MMESVGYAEAVLTMDMSCIYRDEYLEVQSDAEVTVAGKRVRLTPTEHRLLVCLANNEGLAVTEERLLEEVWGPEYAEYGEYTDWVRIYVWRLRQKLEEDTRRPRYIHSEDGAAYRFGRADWVNYVFQWAWDSAQSN